MARSKKLLCSGVFSSPQRAANSSSFWRCSAFRSARHFDEQPREEIAALAAVHVDHAFAAQLEALAALRAGRDFESRFAFERRHRHFAAERGGRKGDRHFAKKIVVFALEDRVLLHVDDDVEIALSAAANARFAVAGGAQPRAVRDPGRDLEFDPAGLFDAAFAVACVGTAFSMIFAEAAAARAGLRDLEKSARADRPGRGRRRWGS